MSDRRDYLPVCNDHGVPLPDFQAAFCVRCMQRECSRSRAGGLFETRVATWQERLFINPPRMPENDPLFSTIAAKMFKDIDVGRIPEVGGGAGGSAWVDPLTPEASRRESDPTPRAARAAPVTAPPVAHATDVTSGPPPAPQSKPRAPLNTPFVQGTMIGGAAPSKSAVDPWAARAAAETAPQAASSKVVSPGAKIRFRSGGG